MRTLFESLRQGSGIATTVFSVCFLVKGNKNVFAVRSNVLFFFSALFYFVITIVTTVISVRFLVKRNKTVFAVRSTALFFFSALFYFDITIATTVFSVRFLVKGNKNVFAVRSTTLFISSALLYFVVTRGKWCEFFKGNKFFFVFNTRYNRIPFVVPRSFIVIIITIIIIVFFVPRSRAAGLFGKASLIFCGCKEWKY